MPVERNWARSTPAMMAEGMQIGQKLGMEIATELQQELQAQGNSYKLRATSYKGLRYTPK